MKKIPNVTNFIRWSTNHNNFFGDFFCGHSIKSLNGWPNFSSFNLCPFLPSVTTGATQRQFSPNICSEDDLRSRIFGTFVVKFLVCLPLLGFSNI